VTSNPIAVSNLAILSSNSEFPSGLFSNNLNKNPVAVYIIFLLIMPFHQSLKYQNKQNLFKTQGKYNLLYFRFWFEFRMDMRRMYENFSTLSRVPV